MHDLDLVRLGAVKKSGHVTIVHDHDTITHAKNLRHFGRDHDDGKTLAGELGDEPVDFRLCAHIDSTGGFVQNQDLRLGEQPTTNEGLLLVAAAQVLDALVKIRRLDSEHAFELFAFRIQASLTHEPVLDVAVHEHCDLHVLEDREHQEAAGVLAILSQKRHPGVHCGMRRVDEHFLAVDNDFSRGGRSYAEYCLGNVCSTCTHQSGEAKDLAFAKVEGNIAKDSFQRQIFDRERHISDGNNLLGKHGFELAANHFLYQYVAVDIAGPMCGDVSTVPENRYIVGDRENFIHLVGDIDDADAMRLEIRDDGEEVIHFALGKRGRRLIHDQNVGFERHRLGDLDDLPIGNGQVSNLNLRIDVDAEAAKEMVIRGRRSSRPASRTTTRPPASRCRPRSTTAARPSASPRWSQRSVALPTCSRTRTRTSRTRSVSKPVTPERPGYVDRVDARAVGLVVTGLGGNRRREDDQIDYGVGLTDVAPIGAEVGPDRPLAIVHARGDSSAEEAATALRAAVHVSAEAPAERRVLLGRV